MGCGMPAAGEPLWTVEDRAIALAWQQYDDGLCSCCGVPKEIAWSQEHQFDWRGEVMQCHVGAAMQRALRKHRESGGPEVEVDNDAIHAVAHRRDDS